MWLNLVHMHKRLETLHGTFGFFSQHLKNNKLESKPNLC